MIVANNLIAMNTQRQFNIVNKKKAKSTEKLSSGYRINRASDDAAGLSISERMRKQINGLDKGINNTQDGVSMCQVGDGALAEVSAMLQRVTQLSVQAANGTLEPSERQDIQREISQILNEIDRIGSTTDFNTIKLFDGNDTILTNADGSPFIEGNIPFGDFSLADVSLGVTPFDGNANNTPRLNAIVDNPDSAAYMKNYNLIFGNGSTSYASIRATNSQGESVIDLSSFRSTGVNQLSDTSWENTLTYSDANGFDIQLIQKISTRDTSATQKDYTIEYEFQNMSSDNITLDVMFHADTAYNNNDTCEGYFIGQNRIDQTTVYAKDTSTTVPKAQNDSNANVIYNNMPSDFSIVDVDSALPFSEKITLNGVETPDVVSVGIYSSIYDWNYYTESELATNLGQDTHSRDLGFSLIWEDKALAAGGSFKASFDYGIVATNSDTNLPPVNMSSDPVVTHEEVKKIWIQSSSKTDDGMYLDFGEMNSRALGIDSIDVTTQLGAKRGLEMVDKGLQYVSDIRARIGAQQNRLQHTIDNNGNAMENLTAAESTIRDTDMADEMVKYSIQSILSQTGQSMLAQANQSNQGVLSLLQ